MRSDFLTLEAVEAFDRDGYLIVDGLLDAEETALLREIAKQDRLLSQRRTSRADGEGGAAFTVRSCSVNRWWPRWSSYCAMRSIIIITR
jgi:hypothetical protein